MHIQIYYNANTLFVGFTKRYTSLLQQRHAACASWPAEASLQTIPIPPQNFWDFTTWKYVTSPASSPFTATATSAAAGLLFLILFNLYRAQIAAACHGLPAPRWQQGGQRGHRHPGQAALPPCAARTVSPRFSLSPRNAAPQHLLLPSRPPACQYKQPVKPNLLAR